ncbi:hypothetical protein [Sphingomonas sp.]|uniref:hypothetical protein n=1 Tax=Sphingomonas sp. TaxID=28214 RepID=UPI0025FB734D|nr:hypothetical protein [Sphingomonas sp.]MBV9529319.1 hypothetical protein [Sphingomonas sp.]
MTFGLSPRLFIEDGPAIQSALLQAQRSTARSWRILDADHRYAAIESVLRPANDGIDELPIAL